jgi:redox-sensitive bicupin YhaK (pirin superfamily)
MQTRNIKKVFKAQPVLEGAGVRLKRAMGYKEAPQFDPFLLLDDFRSGSPEDYIRGFPWHPHRGIETITYVLKGTVEHGDSLANSGVISAGDVQWMTAGSGIIHQEMPKGDLHGAMYGFQLWSNLPASHKMMDPRYREIKEAEIPEIALDNGTKIRLICGSYGNSAGPAKDIITDPEYLDITVPESSEFIHATKKEDTVFAYVIEGRGIFCREKRPFSYQAEGINYFDFAREPFVSNETLVLFDAGDEIVVETEDQPIRFLLISGKPLREPVAWYGPIVMNTQQELETAFREYQNNTFVKYRKSGA